VKVRGKAPERGLRVEPPEAKQVSVLAQILIIKIYIHICILHIHNYAVMYNIKGQETVGHFLMINRQNYNI